MYCTCRVPHTHKKEEVVTTYRRCIYTTMVRRVFGSGGFGYDGGGGGYRVHPDAVIYDEDDRLVRR